MRDIAGIVRVYLPGLKGGGKFNAINAGLARCLID